jgi:hypothetical protein
VSFLKLRVESYSILLGYKSPLTSIDFNHILHFLSYADSRPKKGGCLEGRPGKEEEER